MGRDAEAGAETKNRSRVLGDVGLEKRDLHSVTAGRVPMKSLNKSRLRA
jgi:hypothetical protein